MNHDSSYKQIVLKARKDEGFKASLMSDPVAALEEAGANVPQGVKVKVVEDSADTMHLILPHWPEEEELDMIVAGSRGCYSGTTTAG